MNILFAIIIIITAFSGCGYNKKQIRDIVDKQLAEKIQVGDPAQFAVRDDLHRLKRQIKDHIRRSVDHHKKNWPHGCEVSCK